MKRRKERVSEKKVRESKLEENITKGASEWDTGISLCLFLWPKAKPPHCGPWYDMMKT